MDKKTLINNLHALFCATNRSDRKYSSIWLSSVDFGGLYTNNKYTLNIKAEHEINECNTEIESVIDLLHVNATEELKYIWNVNIYSPDDAVHCVGEDILVYAEENACN